MSYWTERTSLFSFQITIFLDGALAREVLIKHSIFAEEHPKVGSLMLELGHVLNTWSNAEISRRVFMGPLHLFNRELFVNAYTSAVMNSRFLGS